MNKAQLTAQGERASHGLFAWSQFVAHTECLWQDTTLVTDAAAWQRQWFELEIINGLALAEWEEQGRPEDFSARWREGYQQEAFGLVNELLALVADPYIPG
ncbi:MULTISPECIES: hypothetical protein [unclassified Pseudomonas]|uniref:hypothetical protein n=1 Tax=unclassified Pseudomonas TaxID=196821 RepID=UPI0008E67A02|nr:MULTISPECIES: hypothetical protein [unclassified Pseudomonas]SFI96638.1 hypothetical protein SAMN03159342_05650 [Pseudomonas sp. NFPP04]SFK07866.1 hypothetical protein SAMN03159344_05652 [Pseudomonas sp. NFPP11]